MSAIANLAPDASDEARVAKRLELRERIEAARAEIDDIDRARSAATRKAERERFDLDGESAEIAAERTEIDVARSRVELGHDRDLGAVSAQRQLERKLGDIQRVLLENPYDPAARERLQRLQRELRALATNEAPLHPDREVELRALEERMAWLQSRAANVRRTAARVRRDLAEELHRIDDREATLRCVVDSGVRELEALGDPLDQDPAECTTSDPDVRARPAADERLDHVAIRLERVTTTLQRQQASTHPGVAVHDAAARDYLHRSHLGWAVVACLVALAAAVGSISVALFLLFRPQVGGAGVAGSLAVIGSMLTGLGYLVRLAAQEARVARQISDARREKADALRTFDDPDATRSDFRAAAGQPAADLVFGSDHDELADPPAGESTLVTDVARSVAEKRAG